MSLTAQPRPLCWLPMGAGRAWGRGQWEPEGGGSLLFKERREVGALGTERQEGANGQSVATMSLQVSQRSAGRLGGHSLGREVLKGAWGRRDALQAVARLGPSGQRPCPDPPGAVRSDPEDTPTPFRAPPYCSGDHSGALC